MFIACGFIQCKSQKQEVTNESHLNVKDFGAKGNGISNDTKAILKADREANAKNKSLYFPNGTYRAHGIKITSDWYGEGSSVIMANKLVKNPTKDPFCSIEHQRNLSVKNLIFNGNVSDDPANWETGYDNFVGQYGLFVKDCNDINIESCQFLNANKSLLRIQGSKKISLSSSKLKKVRGAFGDGIYIKASTEVIIFDCNIEDYTRIGIVVEHASSDIKIENCHIRNGHHGSQQYGHSQFNSGYWFENSGNISLNNCSSTDNENFGFVFSFNKWENRNKNQLSMIACTSKNAPMGFKIASSKITPIRSSITKSKALNCNQGFVANSNHFSDVFEFEDNLVEIYFSNKTKNEIAYMWNVKSNREDQYAKISYVDCKVNHINEVSSFFRSPKTNTADFSCYDCADVEIIIDHCQNTDANTPIVLKSRTSKGKFKLKDSNMDLIAVKKGSQFEIDNVNLSEASKKKMNSNIYKTNISGQ